jgi:hypothetical protein
VTIVSKIEIEDSMEEENRSAFVIAYLFMIIYGLLLGIFIGWMIWG